MATSFTRLRWRHLTLVAPWERAGENREYFNLFSTAGYATGVNVVLYAMTTEV